MQTAPRVQRRRPEPHDPELDTVVPDTRTSRMTCASRAPDVDDGEYFEVHEHHAKNIICGFSRLDGFAVGIVGNQPAQLAGVLDIDASAKAARSCGPATHSTSR